MARKEGTRKAAGYRGNVVLQYTAVAFAVTLSLSLALGSSLSRLVTRHLVEEHVAIYPRMVRTLIEYHPAVLDFVTRDPGSLLSEEVSDYFEDLFELGEIDRIKVWNREGTILWSDEQHLIGENFGDNGNFREALGGRVAYEISRPEGRENATEVSLGQILEIYTPLVSDGEVVSVLELYQSEGVLSRRIAEARRTVWISITAAGITLYVLLFLFFYRAYLRQKHIAQRLIRTQDATIYSLAYQAEMRDSCTGRHLERTSRYVRVLAEELQKHAKYSGYLSTSYITDLIKAAPLHDIGKVGISDAILRKPGKLTREEFEEMTKHCDLGTHVLRKAEENLPFESFLSIAVQIVHYHHEKWDGSGYPHGLAGENIPLSARLMAVADVYDALRFNRPYRSALTHRECVDIISSDSGRHFDPLIVDIFLAEQETFMKISETMQDGDEEYSPPGDAPPDRAAAPGGG